MRLAYVFHIFRDLCTTVLDLLSTVRQRANEDESRGLKMETSTENVGAIASDNEKVRGVKVSTCHHSIAVEFNEPRALIEIN